MSLEGLDSGWYALSSTAVSLTTRGQLEQLPLVVTPPLAPTVLTDYEFTLIATSAADSTLSVRTYASLRLEFVPSVPELPTGGLSISIQPHTAYAPAVGETFLTITATNGQNFDDRVTVEFTDSALPLGDRASPNWFDWTSIEVFLPAGGSIQLTVGVAIPAGAASGAFWYRSTATSAADLARAAEGGGTNTAEL